MGLKTNNLCSARVKGTENFITLVKLHIYYYRLLLTDLTIEFCLPGKYIPIVTVSVHI